MHSGLSGLLFSISSYGVPLSWEDAGVIQKKEEKRRNLIKCKYSCIITMNMLGKCLFRFIIDVLNSIFKYRLRKPFN